MTTNVLMPFPDFFTGKDAGKILLEQKTKLPHITYSSQLSTNG